MVVKVRWLDPVESHAWLAAERAGYGVDEARAHALSRRQEAMAELREVGLRLRTHPPPGTPDDVSFFDTGRPGGFVGAHSRMRIGRILRGVGVPTFISLEVYR